MLFFIVILVILLLGLNEKLFLILSIVGRDVIRGEDFNKNRFDLLFC